MGRQRRGDRVRGRRPGVKDTITGVKLSYVLTEEEIRTCMRGTQFGKRRKRRMRIELVVFSALL